MTGQVEATQKVRSMHPQKFAMWLFLVSVTMFFGSYISAYMVQKGAKDLFLTGLPTLLLYTTIIILLSSVSMQYAYISAKRNNIGKIKVSLLITLVLGILFTVGQFMAWRELVDAGVHFVNSNPLESFIYIFTGLHLAHLFAAVIFLIAVLGKAYNYQVHSKSLVRLEMCATFWHFLGGLWLCLYLFLNYYS